MWIDSLGAIIAVLSIIVIIRIYRRVKNQEEQIPYDENLKTLFISSTGGHFNELMQLKPIMEKTNYQIVTEKTKQNQNLKQEYGKKMHFLLRMNLFCSALSIKQMYLDTGPGVF